MKRRKSKRVEKKVKLEKEKTALQTWTRPKVLPVRQHDCGSAPITITHFEDVYGFRGPDPRVHLLSPWEFFMY